MWQNPFSYSDESEEPHYGSDDYDNYIKAQIDHLDSQYAAYIEQMLMKELQEVEKATFESVPKCGRHAHAYNDTYDNIFIYEMREKKSSFQEIADKLGCSKSTVKNRYDKLKNRYDDLKKKKAEIAKAEIAKSKEKQIKSYLKSFMN